MSDYTALGYNYSYLVGAGQQAVASTMFAIQALEDSVITAKQNNGSTQDVTLLAGIIIHGRYNDVTVTSGSVLVYSLYPEPVTVS